MKTLILTLSLLLSHSAFASYFAIQCSAGDLSVQTTSGHMENKFIFSALNKEYKTYHFQLSYDAVTSEILDSQELRSESIREDGMSTWTVITYQRTKFTRTDGKHFPKWTRGVSEDRKSVTADLICQEEGNSF